MPDTHPEAEAMSSLAPASICPPSALHDCLADLEDILAPHVPCQKAVEQCMRLYTVHGR